MKQIYIDDDFKCHATDLEGTRTVETDFFDGKCNEYIEGYRFVPAGKIWTREDGEVFEGEMIAPHTDFNELLIAQMTYEFIPGTHGTESLFSIVDEEHAGTKTAPIPFQQNMEIYEGLYYKQYDVLYLCTRSSGHPLYHDLSLLVGSYVEVVNEA